MKNGGAGGQRALFIWSPGRSHPQPIRRVVTGACECHAMLPPYTMLFRTTQIRNSNADAVL